MASPPTEARTGGARMGGALPLFSWKTSLVVLVVLGLTGWSFYGTEFDLVELFSSTRPMERFVSGMFPPDFSAVTLRQTGTGLMETFQMSFLGALIGAAAALPLSALATQEPSTVGASRTERLLRAIPYHAARLVINVFRSVPDILWALVFVVAVGLGPFPGTLALAVHSAGILGKLYSETLEAVPNRPLRAIPSGRERLHLAHALPVGVQHPFGGRAGPRRGGRHRTADHHLYEPLRLLKGRQPRWCDHRRSARGGRPLDRDSPQARLLASGCRVTGETDVNSEDGVSCGAALRNLFFSWHPTSVRSD